MTYDPEAHTRFEVDENGRVVAVIPPETVLSLPDYGLRFDNVREVRCGRCRKQVR